MVGGGCVASIIVAAATEVGFSLVWAGSSPAVLLRMSLNSVTDKTRVSTEASWLDTDDEWKEGRVGIGFCNVKLMVDDGKVEPATDACVMDVDLPLVVEE